MNNEYRSISIPVLFVQGKNDYNSPVESVYHIRDSFGLDTYSCWFREMGHVPDDETDIVQILNDIAGWIGE